jgi:hypothetical protein
MEVVGDGPSPSPVKTMPVAQLYGIDCMSNVREQRAEG